MGFVIDPLAKGAPSDVTPLAVNLAEMCTTETAALLGLEHIWSADDGFGAGSALYVRDRITATKATACQPNYGPSLTTVGGKKAFDFTSRGGLYTNQALAIGGDYTWVFAGQAPASMSTDFYLLGSQESTGQQIMIQNTGTIGSDPIVGRPIMRHVPADGATAAGPNNTLAVSTNFVLMIAYDSAADVVSYYLDGTLIATASLATAVGNDAHPTLWSYNQTLLNGFPGYGFVTALFSKCLALDANYMFRKYVNSVISVYEPA